MLDFSLLDSLDNNNLHSKEIKMYLWLGPSCVEFACSPCVGVGSLQVLQLPPTVQKHAYYYWNSVGAKTKSSTLARTWSHVIRHRGKPSTHFTT